MSFTITRAVRKSVPLLVSLAGVSGAGKSYSALLLAAGLAGKGRVGFLDTENGRGSMYADSPGIKAALPEGYDIAGMRDPFSPDRYLAAVDEFERHGCSVLVVDSMTHEWEGDGGCCDIAEANKMKGTPNWALAKMKHKRMMNRLLASPMHLVLCLRAREKVLMRKDANGRSEVVPIGLTPIQEKNFVFEMTVSLLLDELTHLPQALKCPEPLLHLFDGRRLLTRKDGEQLRAWSEAAPAPSLDAAALESQAEAYARSGVDAYREFFLGLPVASRAALEHRHAAFKAAAQEADLERARARALAEDDEPDFADAAKQAERWGDQ